MGMPSSVIRTFDYDPASRALDIEFVSGRRYRYAAVPGDVVEDFRRAFSKGQFFNNHIRDHFAAEELELDSEEWGSEWA
jgi:lysyl-tRNA synthetase class 2